jgi:hypothetical protein
MKPAGLRGTLQYIPQFREKTFVLAVDGALVPVVGSWLRGVGWQFNLSS